MQTAGLAEGVVFLLETLQLRRLTTAALDVILSHRTGVAAAGGSTTSAITQLLQDEGPTAVAAVLRECIDDIRAVVAGDADEGWDMMQSSAADEDEDEEDAAAGSR